MAYAIGPVPTPYPPAGVSYTPQLSGGQIYDDASNTNVTGGYALPGGAPEPTYTPSNTYTTPTTTNTSPAPAPAPAPAPTNNVSSFDDIYSKMYPGWGRTEAYNDWVAKGRPNYNAPSSQVDQAKVKMDNFISNNPYSDITPAWNPDDFTAQLDEIYNQAMGHANTQTQYATQLKEGNIADINQSFGTSQQALGNSKSQAMGTLDESAISSRQQQEKSLDAIRNLYNELTQGYQQRYGGASGAGEFAKAMAAKSMQQSAGQTRQATGDALRKIQTEKANVEQNYNNSLQQLQDKKDMAVREANNNFSAAMVQIDQDKMTAGQEKALAKMNLLKEYKTNLFNIQSQAKAFEANIAQMREQANIELDSYLKQAGASAGAGQQASNLGFGTPTSNLQIGQSPLSQAAMTGQIKKDELQNYLGMIGQSRTDIPLWMQR